MIAANKDKWEFPIVIPKNPVKKAIKNLVGHLAQVVKPSIKKDLLNGKHPTNKIERAVLCSIFVELRANNQYDKLAELHKNIWSSNDAQGYYGLTSNRLQGMFNSIEEHIHDTLTMLIRDNTYQQLVELGCGEGIVVESLSRKFRNIPNFTGIDINQAQIEINKQLYKHSENLHFFAGDLVKDIDLIKGPDKIFLSFGGVLEYLTEEELIGFFSELSAFKNIIIIIYEPIAHGFDIKNEKHSMLYGSEFSFCHPYYYYFTKLGFKIITEKAFESDGIDFVYLAVKNF